MDGPDLLGECMSSLVRVFGLLEEDRTPCGYPIPVSVAHALLELLRVPLLPQWMLTERLHLEKSTVTRLVDVLVRRGWVGREADRHDRRVIRLSLTDAGRQAANQLSSARSRRFTTIFERIPCADRSQVLRALAILAEAVDEQPAVSTRKGVVS